MKFPDPPSPDQTESIAILGLAGRFPGARSLEEFWRNLREGRSSVSFSSAEELAAAGVDPALSGRPDYVPAAGILADVELFDAEFFGLSPREAELLDPQHRLFLECAFESLEHAGIDVERFPGRVGVFGGVGPNEYFLAHLQSRPELLEEVGQTAAQLFNQGDFFTTRVSYKLDLRGPSVTVQSACSSSLAAVHLACQSLWTGECEVALAGGACVHVPQRRGHLYQEGGTFSRDGYCRAFDAAASGMVSGSGVGVVVLKRLAEAQAAGDRIHAVIRGSAMNNDGAAKMGFTAPSPERQAEVVAEALAVADVEPETLAYIEAHGSGTVLGDPIELEALTRAFRSLRRRPGSCAVGSVKTNIGHAGAAAGIAGLVKTVLALERGQLPPSLHFETPNPEIDFAGGPFYVNTRLRAWPPGSRRAGVSSFGLGGTNVHVVLEQAPPAAASGPSRPAQVLLLSARSAAALDASAARLAAHLEEHPELDLADAAYTLAVGRRPYEYRRALVAPDRAAAIAALRSGGGHRGRLTPGSRPIAFVFSGLGDQSAGMTRQLYDNEPTFRREIDRCAELARADLDVDLRRILYPGERSDGVAVRSEPGAPLAALLRRGAASGSAGLLSRTLYAQPALFAVEYALACLLMEWGLVPRAMIGYSLGEYVAACLAGVLRLEDALRLVASRARLIDEQPAGAMLAVPLSAAEVRPWLADSPWAGRWSLSAVNGPDLTVIGGPPETVAACRADLDRRGVLALRLRTAHAFHTPLLQPAAAELTRCVRAMTLSPPQVPYVSNLTGTWITDAEATDPAYWARHMCETVRFESGLGELLRAPRRILLEVGPGNSLSTLAQQHPSFTPEHTALPTLGPADGAAAEAAHTLSALGRLWTVGVEIDSPSFYAHERRRRQPLPTYPFERRRFWIEPAARSGPPTLEAPAKGSPRLSPELPLESPDSEPPPARHTEVHPRGDLSTPYTAPTTSAQERLVELWQRLFGVEQIGVDDNFFELGGYSLLAIQLTSRIRSAFGVELTMTELFESPTVAALAARIEESGKDRPPAGPEVRPAAEDLSEAELEHLLCQVEGLSSEKVEELLAREEISA